MSKRIAAVAAIALFALGDAAQSAPKAASAPEPEFTGVFIGQDIRTGR